MSTLELLNFAEFEAKAKLAMEALKTAGVDRLEAVAESVAEDARHLVPVLTGELRDSIAVKKKHIEVEVGSYGVEYAHFVEYGTSKMTPRPFLRPALAAADKHL